MTWFGTGLDWVVEVAFDDPPLDPAPTWTDISEYVGDDWSTRTGRTSMFTTFGAGSLSLELDNEDRRFDPLNSAGPYFAKLTPMRRIRVRAVYDSVSYPLLDGFVQGWPTGVDGNAPLLPKVQISAVDASWMLENDDLARSAYEAVVLADGPMHFWPLQEQNTTASAQYADVVAGSILYNQFFRNSDDYVPPTPIERTLPIGAGTMVRPSHRVVDVASDANVSMLTSGSDTDAPPYGLSFWLRMSGWSGDGATSLQGFPRVAVRRYNVDGDGAVASVSISSPLSVSTPRQVTVAWADPDESETFELLTNIYVPPGLHHLALWKDPSSDAVTVWLDGEPTVLGDVATGIGARTDPFNGVVIEGGPRLVTKSTDISEFSHVAVWGADSDPDFREHYLAGVTAYGHPFGERSGERIGRVLDEIGWPAGLRDLPTGDTVQGPYIPARSSALDYMREVETSEDGLLFLDGQGRVTLRDRQWQWLGSTADVVEFADDGTGLRFHAVVIAANTVDAIRNRVAVSYGAGGFVAVDDATSIAAYGVMSDNLSASTLESRRIAEALAAYRVSQMKDPQTLIPRMVLRPRPDMAPTDWPTVLGITIGARVQLTATPAEVGDPIVLQFFVQGVDDRVGGDGVWERTLHLMPARESAADAPYLIVGDATNGQIGATAGNQIPF